MSVFNINKLRDKIKSNFSTSSQADEVRGIYKEELMDWIDCYNETLKSDPTNPEAIQAKESILNLFIDFASFEKKLKQFKKVVQVYESALEEPIIKSCSDIYNVFALYYKERGKSSNAKKTFIRGLCTKELCDEFESDKLWYYFLIYMHEENQSKDLKIDQLHEAVKAQLSNVEDVLIPPSNNFEANAIIFKATIIDSSTEKTADQISQSTEVKNILEQNKTFIKDSRVSAESKEPEYFDFSEKAIDNEKLAESRTEDISNQEDMVLEIDDLDDLSNQTPDSLIRMYHHRPPTLFSAPDKVI